MTVSPLLAQFQEQTAQGPIAFREFMAMALYDPQWGYYGGGQVKIDPQGDFVTSGSLGRDFGELLAVQFQEMWQRLGCPDRFTLLELGAGQGDFAAVVLAHVRHQAPAFYQALDYGIVEISPQLQRRQQETLKDFSGKVTWHHWHSLGDRSLVGCVFSNELFDALPVHLVTWHQGKLQEIYVQWQETTIEEVIQEPSTPALQEYFQEFAIDFDRDRYPDGYRTEVNLEAKKIIEEIAQTLHQGYVLTIDYGYTAEKYYHPQRHQGTIKGYTQHRHHNNPYVNLGQQDLTAHVNFSALERWGENHGLKNLAFTQQAKLLIALGLSQRFSNLISSPLPLPEMLNRRSYLHELMNPMGLGGFGVLLQGKNLTPAMEELQGFHHGPQGRSPF